MKNKMFLAAFMLLAASCSNDESLDSSVKSNEQAAAPVTVRVGGFAVSQSDFSVTGGDPEGTGGMTRATAVVVLASCEKAIINDEGATSDANGSSSTSVTGVTVNTDWAGETHLTF